MWLGTTALVAAGFAVQDARAADPLQLSVGGNQVWGLAIASYDTAPGVDEPDSMGLRMTGKVIFKAKTVLDNGLEVGTRAEFRGEKSKDIVDEAYTWVEGSFGELRVGNDDPASYQMSTTAPYATFIWGLNTPTFSVGSGEGIGGTSTLTTYGGTGIGQSASVMYFTPVLNGIQLGLSFAPEAGEERDKINGNGALEKEGGQAWSVAARYNGTMGDIGVTLAAGYASWDVEKVAAVPEVIGNYIVHTLDSDGNRLRENPDGGGNTRWQYVRYPGANLPDDASDADKEKAAADRKEWLAGTATREIEEVTAPKAPVPAKAARSPAQWNVGLQLSMGNMSVGGSYLNTDPDDGSDDTDTYDLGVGYSEGPWGLSVNWGRSSTGDADTDLYRMLTTYDMGAGVSLTGAVGMNRPEANNADSEFVGMAISTSF